MVIEGIQMGVFYLSTRMEKGSLLEIRIKVLLADINIILRSLDFIVLFTTAAYNLLRKKPVCLALNLSQLVSIKILGECNELETTWVPV